MDLTQELAKRRERLTNRLQADADAVDAARAALTAPPADGESKALAETMYARIWPGVLDGIATTRLEDGGTAAALEAIQDADPVVRPLLTSSVIDALKANGLNEETIDKHVLVPSSQKLRDAIEIQRRNEIAGVAIEHNISQREQGTTNFVGDANADLN
ncbi:hypothetical protein [Rhodococcus opacus]|uniref:hypothetical protein n=1 Tax=Rhodococcus opacus TaxID=37919 RepID=UPI00223595A2|nr:hypothetical protein [Rhodococcus opacus]UZG58015.1 hypothetical protein ONE62_12215 [Rhodococcus opacus]